MGFSVSKAFKKVKKAASSINKERKRAVSSVGKELERGVKNPDVWKAAALIAAPYALPALGIGGGAAGAAGATGGGGFMSSIAGAASKVVGGVSGLFGGGAAGAEGAAGGGFFDSVFSGASNLMQKMGGDIAAKASDPEYMAGMFKKAVATLGGSKMAGDALSPQEKALMNNMVNQLKQMQDQDQGLFNERLQAAREVMQEGRSISTEQGGLKAQRDVQVAGGAGLREADRQAQMREGGRGLSAADRARFALDTTAKGQSAYLGGLESAQNRRLNAIATGAGLLPEQAPSGSLYGGLNVAARMDVQDTRKRTAQKDTGKFIEGVFGWDKQQSQGTESLEEAVPEKAVPEKTQQPETVVDQTKKS